MGTCEICGRAVTYDEPYHAIDIGSEVLYFCVGCRHKVEALRLIEKLAPKYKGE